MPDKLLLERLRLITATSERFAREAGEAWVSEEEIHVMAEELIELRLHVTKLEAELNTIRGLR